MMIVIKIALRRGNPNVLSVSMITTSVVDLVLFFVVWIFDIRGMLLREEPTKHFCVCVTQKLELLFPRPDKRQFGGRSGFFGHF